MFPVTTDLAEWNIQCVFYVMEDIYIRYETAVTVWSKTNSCMLPWQQAILVQLQDNQCCNKWSKSRFEQTGSRSSRGMWLLPETDTRSTCLLDLCGLKKKKKKKVLQLQKRALLERERETDRERESKRERESLKATCWCQPMLPFGVEEDICFA